MPQHKSKSRFFKEHPIRFKKLVIVFIVFMIFMSCLEYLLHHTPTELARIKEITVEDVDFSDIYYQIREEEPGNPKDVLLVNIGSWSPDSFRNKLPDLIRSIDSFGAKVIGVDLYFPPKHDSDFNTINEKLDQVLQNRKIVTGAFYGQSSEFPFTKPNSVKLGYINFADAEGTTVRQYNYKSPKTNAAPSDRTSSFAAAMFETGGGHVPLKEAGATFFIRYNSGTETGFYNAHVSTGDVVLKDTAHDFPAIEATDLGYTNFTDSVELDRLIRGNYVIIGFLGKPDMNYLNDITDKFRVPLNFQLFNRLPTMPGAVVHANALQMLVKGERVYNIEGWLYYIIEGLIVFLFLLVFNLLHKIRAILLKLVVEIIFLIGSTILLVAASVALMGLGVHINVGKILLAIAVLIEYKMFAFEFYDRLAEQSLRKKVAGWYLAAKRTMFKDALSRKVETRKIEIEINKTDGDEV